MDLLAGSRRGAYCVSFVELLVVLVVLVVAVWALALGPPVLEDLRVPVRLPLCVGAVVRVPAWLPLCVGAARAGVARLALVCCHSSDWPGGCRVWVVVWPRVKAAR